MERKWLKEIREKKQLLQKEVAIDSDISQQYYSLIEKGKRDLKPDIAKRIANVLGFYWGRFYE